jgi:hypothetical protein
VSWGERILGIVLGVILGIGVVIVFVFVYSEQTVDAPSIGDHSRASGNRQAGRGGATRSRGGRPVPPPIATVRIAGGAPPPKGPAQLDYRRGDLVRLRVVSDQAVDLQLLGYGSQFAVQAGGATIRRFRASRSGNFALVVIPSHIDVARISVGAARAGR